MSENFKYEGDISKLSAKKLSSFFFKMKFSSVRAEKEREQKVKERE